MPSAKKKAKKEVEDEEMGDEEVTMPKHVMRE